MKNVRLLELAGITEARYAGKWVVIRFNRYDAHKSTVHMIPAASNVHDALTNVFDGEAADYYLNSGNQGRDVWAHDGDEESILVFPGKE